MISLKTPATYKCNMWLLSAPCACVTCMCIYYWVLPIYKSNSAVHLQAQSPLMSIEQSLVLIQCFPLWICFFLLGLSGCSSIRASCCPSTWTNMGTRFKSFTGIIFHYLLNRLVHYLLKSSNRFSPSCLTLCLILLLWFQN